MQLSPRERDRLLVHVAAEVAQKRRDRGLKFNDPEAVALLTSWVDEGARDGRTVVDLMDAGCRVLTRDDVMDGIAEMADEVQVEATSTVSVREAVSLGRVGEPCGRLALRQRVTIDGVAVLDHETVLAPGALLGPGAHGNHRRMSSEVHIGTALPAARVEVSPACCHATLHVSSHCALSIRTSDGC